jgi:hypothetical protein
MKTKAMLLLALSATAAMGADQQGLTCSEPYYSQCTMQGAAEYAGVYNNCVIERPTPPPSFQASRCIGLGATQCLGAYCSWIAQNFLSDYYAYCQGLYCTEPSPIVISRAGHLHLTSAQQGVAFDIDGDGDLDHIAWTAPGSVGEPFLALDRNGNGLIDNGAELFGTATPQRPATGEGRNGFVALRAFDADSDGTVYSWEAPDLLLWQDYNHNGVSDPAELRSAWTELVSVDTSYRTSRRTDQYGNRLRWRGNAHGASGRLVLTDVIFATQ